VPTENGLYDSSSTIHSRYYSFKIVSNKTVYIIPPVQSTAGIIHVRLLSTENGLYDTTSIIRSRYYSCRNDPAGNGLYDTTSNIQNMYYSWKILQTEKCYIILPVQYNAGSMNVRLCPLKTVYMITQVISKAGIILVILCQMKNV